MKILVLGGTGEARMLANRLAEMGHDVTTSLAGRTREPLLPEGGLRVGGFGGVPGLCAYLAAGRYDRLVDATHPYAGLISRNAIAASKATGVSLVRLMRAPWHEPEGAGWLHADTTEAAASLLAPGATVLLTTGHGGLQHFTSRTDVNFLVRLIEPPETALPPNARLLIDRPPYALDGEIALMAREGVTHLVSKNSGGSQTLAKLDAARRLGVGVVMIARPTYGEAVEVADVEAALRALQLDAPRR